LARIYACGWEQNTALVQYDTPYSSTTGGGSSKTISSAVRNTINSVGGKYSCQFENSGANGQNYYDLIFRSITDADSNGPFYMRWYLRVDDLPAADSSLLDLYAIAGGSRRAGVILNTTGGLELWDSNSQIGSDSSAINDGAFHRIEMSWSRSGASMSLELLLNGNTVATGTTSDNVGGAGRIIFGNLTSTSSYDMYWDDFALNDDSGASENSYPGAGVQIMLRPDGAGDTNNLTGGTGTTFAEFDEETPDDDTSYSTLANNNDTVFFTIDDPAAQGMGPSDTVNVVLVGYRWAAVDTSGSCNIAGRIKSQASGTIMTGSNSATDDTSYQSNLGEAPSTNADKYYTVSHTDPQAGGAWTRTLLQTAQIGVIAPDAAPDVQVTSIWALVDFVPASQTFGDIIEASVEPVAGTNTVTVQTTEAAGTPAATDDYGICYRTCTTSPITQGAAGVTCISHDGQTGTVSDEIGNLIPGCTFSVAPYYEVGDTVVYGGTVTSSGTPAASATAGAAALGGLL